MSAYSKWLLAIPCLLCPFIAEAQGSAQVANAGQTFEIVQSYETISETNGEGSSSSSGHSTLIERVLHMDESGIELEYDVPLEADGKRKGVNWQLPARIYRPKNGEPILLNAAELEKRIDPWLKTAKMSREACGQWIFTWNAFKIECDPASALSIVEQYNIWLSNLSEGQPYLESGALVAVPLRIKSSDKDGSVYIAELEIDPAKVKIEKAESDVIVGKITGQSKTFEDALAAQADNRISGTISVTIETSPAGQVKKRTSITKLRIEAGGEMETSTKSVTLERRLLDH